MIFPSRRRGGPDPHLDWKVRLFYIGAALALLGIGLESRILVGLAIAVLVLGASFRLLPGVGGGSETGESEGEEPSPE